MIDLKQLEKQLDDTLNNETKESLTSWILTKRAKNKMEVEKIKPITREDFIRMSSDEKISRSEFFVEADSFAKQALWEQHFYDKKDGERLEWIQDSSGFSRLIGFMDKNKQNPIYVSFGFYAIGGKYICFYYPEGTYADWNQIEAYINSIVPKYDSGTRNAKCDANNFHQCLSFCRE